MSSTAHTAFFGDGEHVFDLAKPEIVRELEAATGAGIGALAQRVLATRTFAHADLEHILRLGLIGGGLDPKTAARLVKHYLPMRPLIEAEVVAADVLNALWIGTPAEAEPTHEQIMNGAITGSMGAAITAAVASEAQS